MRYLQANRFPLLALCLAIVGLFGALVLQYGFGMAPCPLCILQRLALVAIAVVALLQLGTGGRFRRFCAGLGLAAAFGGFGLAAWHTAKVVAPSAETTCGPGLGTWVDSLWTADLLPSVFAPMGDCFQDAASLFGLPLPAYACGLFAVAVFLFAKNAINGKHLF